jgi:hypothetical protein
LNDTFSYKKKSTTQSRYGKQEKERMTNYRQLFKDPDGEIIGSPSKVLRGLKRFEACTESQALMYMYSDTTHGKILKFADQMLKFPKKERFNQDLTESVREIKQRTNKSVSKFSGD